jgi:ADP-ribose pyrophosphatase
VADDSHLIEKRLGGRVLLSGGFLEVHKDDVALPDGSQATREYIRHDGAVAVVPLLDEGPDPLLVLVRQFRHPTGQILLEIPAGKRDRDEAQLVCAQRELAEETGYAAREWAFAGEFFNAPAYSTEMIWIWLARGLVPGPARPDAGEFVETVTMRLSELAAVHDRGELPDVKTQLALHWLLRAQATGRAWPWQGVEIAGPL